MQSIYLEDRRPYGAPLMGLSLAAMCLFSSRNFLELGRGNSKWRQSIFLMIREMK